MTRKNIKNLFFLLFLVSVPLTLFAQSRSINSQEARKIAEKFISCAGYTTKTLPAQICGEYKKSCSDETFPCKFLEKKAFGYFAEREDGKKGWTIVFRKRGKLKSDITGVKVTMNDDGTEVRIERTKVFLKLVENRY